MTPNNDSSVKYALLEDILVNNCSKIISALILYKIM